MRKYILYGRLEKYLQFSLLPGGVGSFSGGGVGGLTGVGGFGCLSL